MTDFSAMPGIYGPNSVLPLQRLFINGAFADASSDETFATINPCHQQRNLPSAAGGGGGCGCCCCCGARRF